VDKIYQECCQLTGEEARKITLFNYDTVKDTAEVNAMKQKLREYLDSPEASIYVAFFVPSKRITLPYFS
jgi:hypothetical protein